jgi:hypothetical protein
MINNKWNLQNIPPKGHKDVGEFALLLFDIAREEKERLGKNSDFLANYALYRGKQGRQQQSSRKGYKGGNRKNTLVNLYFANIERTVSNITARNPTGEVVDLDGSNDGSETVLSMELKKWWKETDQQPKTRTSARMMEMYGITIEKPYWDKTKDRPDIMVNDPFAFFPCPGNWDNMSEDAPYICYAYVDFISNIEASFGVTDIAPDEAYELMGAEREDYKPQGYGSQQTIGNYTDAMTVSRKDKTQSNKALQRCLVLELWIRDDRKSSVKIVETKLDEQGNPVLNDNGEEIVIEYSEVKPVFPDGIRKITFTRSSDPTNKSGVIVLDDSANPNINPALPVELARTTYPWGRLPVYHANSYKDGVSVWGFAAAEQVGDLIGKFNLIIEKLVAYVINVMAPPLIIQQNCGITREMIESSFKKSGRLILMPTTPNARIEFMQIPNLPATFFQVLDLVVKFFDRVYQIEDADRGVAPTGVIAASAIVALQERNQVLMQSKTTAIDNLAEQRSRWAIGLFQNFGTAEDTVNVGGEVVPFRGVQFAGRKYNYVVEAGSTTPRTSLQLQELAMQLYGVKAIGQRGLLETLNWPNWKEELERTAESQLDQAFQLIIEAGLPEEVAIKLKEMLLSSSTQTQENEQRKTNQSTTT